jgi:hypothetical protein
MTNHYKTDPSTIIRQLVIPQHENSEATYNKYESDNRLPDHFEKL